MIVSQDIPNAAFTSSAGLHVQFLGQHPAEGADQFRDGGRKLRKNLPHPADEGAGVGMRSARVRSDGSVRVSSDPERRLGRSMPWAWACSLLIRGVRCPLPRSAGTGARLGAGESTYPRTPRTPRQGTRAVAGTPPA